MIVTAWTTIRIKDKLVFQIDRAQWSLNEWPGWTMVGD